MKSNSMSALLSVVSLSLGLVGCATDLDETSGDDLELSEDAQEGGIPACDNTKLKGTGLIANNVDGKITKVQFQVNNQSSVTCHASGTFIAISNFSSTSAIPDRNFAPGIQTFEHKVIGGGKPRPVTLKVCPSTAINNNVCITKFFQ